MHRRCHRPTLLFVTLFLTALLTNERMIRGRKGPGYLERKFQGTNGPGNDWSAEGKVCRVYSFSGTKVSGNERSREGKLHHGNECSRERIVLRTNVPAFLNSPLVPTQQLMQRLQLRRDCDSTAARLPCDSFVTLILEVRKSQGGRRRIVVASQL